jgi:hypothetical protein
VSRGCKLAMMVERGGHTIYSCTSTVYMYIYSLLNELLSLQRHSPTPLDGHSRQRNGQNDKQIPRSGQQDRGNCHSNGAPQRRRSITRPCRGLESTQKKDLSIVLSVLLGATATIGRRCVPVSFLRSNRVAKDDGGLFRCHQNCSMEQGTMPTRR